MLLSDEIPAVAIDYAGTVSTRERRRPNVKLVPALFGGDNKSYPDEDLEALLRCRSEGASRTDRIACTAPTTRIRPVTAERTQGRTRPCARPGWSTSPATGRPRRATRRPWPAR